MTDRHEPHDFEFDHFRIARKWSMSVEIGVCRCGRDYPNPLHFGCREPLVPADV